MHVRLGMQSLYTSNGIKFSISLKKKNRGMRVKLSSAPLITTWWNTAQLHLQNYSSIWTYDPFLAWKWWFSVQRNRSIFDPVRHCKQVAMSSGKMWSSHLRHGPLWSLQCVTTNILPFFPHSGANICSLLSFHDPWTMSPWPTTTRWDATSLLLCNQSILWLVLLL